MSDSTLLLAKTFAGLEPILADELAALGAEQITPGRRMVEFTGDRALLYRVNLCCRTTVRVLQPIGQFTLDAEQSDPYRALYAGLKQIEWTDYLKPSGTLAIDAAMHGALLTNSLYAVQVAKDAVVDWFREKVGSRPSVERTRPDLRINLHVDGDRVTVYRDASCQSLHKRGYRRAASEAPLSEVLAAGILRLSGWQPGETFVDFLCGSGTLPIEAALMARRIAPGTLGREFGYQRWPDFDRALHEQVLATARAEVLPSGPVNIFGSDLDPRVIEAAKENVARAGTSDDVQFSVANFVDMRPPSPQGVIVLNPPYDERLKVASIAAFYARLGDVLKQHWSGYTAWILTGNLQAAEQIGLKPSARVRLFNGPIECRLLKFELYAGRRGKPTDSTTTIAPASIGDAAAERIVEIRENEVVQENLSSRLPLEPAAPGPATLAVSRASSLEMFRNRLVRMGRHWSRWARRQQITCYRVYDRDIPEVPLVIDRYGDALHIVEHERPHARSPLEQQQWFAAHVRAAAEVLEVAAERVFAHSYDEAESRRPDRPQARVIVQEAELSVEVDLSRRGETGLALDERELRKQLATEAAGKRFLNLFGSAAAASLAAAAGGAAATVTVEPSSPLAQWSTRQFEVNDFSDQEHAVVTEEANEFLREHAQWQARPFDLALVAPPPGFHRRDNPEAWNPREAYVELLTAVLGRMVPGGKIYFKSRVKRYRLEPADLPDAEVREITGRLTPPDFRAKRGARYWLIVRGAEE